MPVNEPLIAASRSASGRMMFGDLPPSSSVTRLSARPALAPISRPTAVEPVNAILSTSGWSTSAAPVEPSPVMTLSTPSGIPASSASSPRRSAVSGVCSAGLSTIVQPAASAGADLPGRHQQREVPGDDLAADADRLAPRVGEACSGSRPGASALDLRRPAREVAQVRDRRARRRPWRANFTGLPLSSDSSSRELVGVAPRPGRRAASSRGRGRPALIVRQSRALGEGRARRGDGGVDVGGAGLRDASRSASPVAGSSVSNVAPSAAATHSPPISSVLALAEGAGWRDERVGRAGSWQWSRVCAHVRAPGRSSAPRGGRTARRPRGPRRASCGG